MHKKASLALALCIMAISGYAVIAAWFWPWKAALFPLVIGIPLFLLSALEAAWVLAGRTETPEARGAVQDFKLADHLPEREIVRRSAVAGAWIVGFFVGILLLGFSIAVPLFVFLYLKLEGKESWLLSLVFAAVAWGFFYGLFDRLLHLPFPQGWLLEWSGLS
jgi:hypothetical protein